MQSPQLTSWPLMWIMMKSYGEDAELATVMCHADWNVERSKHKDGARREREHVDGALDTSM